MIPELFWMEILPRAVTPSPDVAHAPAKFWYCGGLLVPHSSVTTRDLQKCLFIDPYMIPLPAGCRIALINHAIRLDR